MTPLRSLSGSPFASVAPLARPSGATSRQSVAAPREGAALCARQPHAARAWLLVALFAAAMGCSGDDEEPLTRTGFCDQWAAAACADAVVEACQAADADACRASQSSACLRRFASDAAFGGTGADACLAAIGSAYADADLNGEELRVVLRGAAPCDRLLSGPGLAGGSCSVTADCDTAQGLVCIYQLGADTSTCEVPASVGAGLDCSAPGSVCEEGFFCNGDNCVGALDPGEDCSADIQCGAEGFCGAGGACSAVREGGEACEFDSECGAALCLDAPTGDAVCTSLVRLGRAEPLCADLT